MVRGSVLSDEMWAQVQAVLPSSSGRAVRSFRDHRQVIEGIIYRLRTGVSWRDLPEFGPWQTVWKRHARFSRDGTWDRVLAQLQMRADAAGQVDWTVSVDSTVVGVHQRGVAATCVLGGVAQAVPTKTRTVS